MYDITWQWLMKHFLYCIWGIIVYKVSIWAMKDVLSNNDNHFTWLTDKPKNYFFGAFIYLYFIGVTQIACFLVSAMLIADNFTLSIKIFFLSTFIATPIVLWELTKSINKNLKQKK